MKRQFSFYEFVGVLVPGILFLFGISLLYGTNPQLKPLLLPDNLGEASVYLVVAYAVGHLVQTVGNLIEYIYWGVRGGKPTDWPHKQPTTALPQRLQEVVARVTGRKAASLAEWQSDVAIVRSKLHSQGKANRLETFNGNYGMFRGIAAAGVVLMLAVILFGGGSPAAYSVLVLATAISIYRMDRFGVHYAKELFAAMEANLLNSKDNGTRN